MDRSWRIEMLGTLQVHIGDRTLAHFPTRKTGMVLARLAWSGQREPRELLAARFWPDTASALALKSLRASVGWLRKLLQDDELSEDFSVLQIERDTLQLAPGLYHTDLEEFRTARTAADHAASPTERISRIEHALRLYRGEFLSGCYDQETEEAGFGWIETERQQLESERLFLLLSLADAREQEGDVRGSLKASQQAVALDPYSEEARERTLRLAARLGAGSLARRERQCLASLRGEAAPPDGHEERLLFDGAAVPQAPKKQTLGKALRRSLELLDAEMEDRANGKNSLKRCAEALHSLGRLLRESEEWEYAQTLEEASWTLSHRLDRCIEQQERLKRTEVAVAHQRLFSKPTGESRPLHQERAGFVKTGATPK